MFKKPGIGHSASKGNASVERRIETPRIVFIGLREVARVRNKLSHELNFGPDGGIEEEAWRAFERANTMMGWIRLSNVAANVEHLYILNLGKYGTDCEQGRAERLQRAVIIVGVSGKQPGVNIEESFRDALYRSRQKVFVYIDIEGYSNCRSTRSY